ncbi:Uncharacterised protein [Neisseria weaveri]|uniref:Uncharacterized protein n=1 Tax=Neisseria weaveri TaxID=28091 RepID=A0A3S5C2S1_9NEIS|nr:hypothetical protein l11_19940 [Neisseria weaveri LMG 5135]VEJ49069.1 Uncharacterised protein [Neisseria weaveri]
MHSEFQAEISQGKIKNLMQSYIVLIKMEVLQAMPFMINMA